MLIILFKSLTTEIALRANFEGEYCLNKIKISILTRSAAKIDSTISKTAIYFISYPEIVKAICPRKIFRPNGLTR